MPNRLNAAVLLAAAAVCGLQGTMLIPTARAEEKADAAAETVDVKLKDLTLTLPKSWKKSAMPSSMRLATFEVPKAEGDSEAGELAIFNFPGGGGGLADNINRWINQFSDDGRTVTLRKGKAGENAYYVADITGTYQKPKGPPVLRQTEPAPGFRMLGVVVELEGKGIYYLKLTGPDATVKAQAENLRRSFGGKVADESDYEI